MLTEGGKEAKENRGYLNIDNIEAELDNEFDNEFNDAGITLFKYYLLYSSEFTVKNIVSKLLFGSIPGTSSARSLAMSQYPL